jgi:type VI secretion system protein ImpA
MADGTGIEDGAADSIARSPTVDAWLEALPDQSCGADPEYDDEFREMEKAAIGKPGTQFAEDSDAVAPDWRAVSGYAETLFERTRDVRVAIYWARSRLRTEGFASLPSSLRLVHGLLDRHWDAVHPMPDGDDAYARVNALNDMASATSLLGDLRESMVVSDRTIGEVRARDVEIALGTLEARSTDPSYSRSQIEQMLAAAAASNPELVAVPRVALEYVERLKDLMRERVGYASAPEMVPITAILGSVGEMMPAAESAAPAPEPEGDGSVRADAGPRGALRSGLPGVIDTRADALKAIDMVCDYLERTEPTNPAQLLLRRARRLVNKNFLELVRELAPESLGEVARIMGMSADEVASSE